MDFKWRFQGLITHLDMKEKNKERKYCSAPYIYSIFGQEMLVLTKFYPHICHIWSMIALYLQTVFSSKDGQSMSSLLLIVITFVVIWW